MITERHRGVRMAVQSVAEEHRRLVRCRPNRRSQPRMPLSCSALFRLCRPCFDSQRFPGFRPEVPVAAHA